MENLESLLIPFLPSEKYKKKEEISNLLRSDYFSINKPKQPKKEIAEYVEKQGILVPKRFNNLKEALEAVKKWKKIIIRSEHPDEYDGVSGLLESIIIEQEDLENSYNKVNIEEINYQDIFFIEKFKKIVWIISEKDMREILIKFSEKKIKKYCKYKKIDEENFKKDISFSYWEYIEWVNTTIIADNAIPNRYHIIRNTYPKYTIVDNGNIHILDLENSVIKGIKNNYLKTKNKKLKIIWHEVYDFDRWNNINDFLPLLEFYENIRKLERFDPFHCPSIEIQEWKNWLYFLQYHKIREQEENEIFILNRPKKEREIEALLVKWTTPPEGITIEVSNMRNIFQENKNKQEGIINFFGWLPFELEIKVRDLKVYIDFSNSELARIADGVTDWHIEKNAIFKPELSIFISNENIEKIKDKLYEDKLKVKIISDGRKAYIEFIE